MSIYTHALPCPSNHIPALPRPHTHDAHASSLIHPHSIPDVIGHTAINAQLLADSFAAQGYMVVLPDLFFGDFIEMNNFANVDLGRWKEGAYSKQGIAHDPASIDPVVAKCIAKMRSELGLREVGALGYCFGAKYVVRFLVGEGEQKPAAEVLDAGFLAHPSFVDEAELRAVKGPVSIAASEIDSIFTAPLRHKSEEILAEIGVPWQICLYGSVSHGFAVRGDLKDRRLKFAMEQAFKQAVDWFREWME